MSESGTIEVTESLATEPGSSVTPLAYRERPRLPALGPERPAASFDLLPRLAALAQEIADTEFVPSSMRRRPAAIVAALLAGAERGFAPMESLRSVHIIEGRPSLSAEAMRALALSRGHRIRIVETTNERAELAGQRAGEEHWTTIEWTREDANRAGLLTKDVWKRYPRAMLLARASTELCRALFPDVVAGLMSEEEVYDVIEVEAEGARPALPPAPPAPASAPVAGAGAGAEEEPPAPASLLSARKLHAMLRDATPDVPTKTRDRWRHALCIVVTRKRLTGATASSSDLDVEEQLALSAILARLQTGEATIGDTAEGLVELQAGAGWRYLVRVSPPGVDVIPPGEEEEPPAGSDAGTPEPLTSAPEPAAAEQEQP